MNKCSEKIIEIASQLGIPMSGSIIIDIVTYCRRKVDGWVAERPTVASLPELAEYVAEKVHATFAHLLTDADYHDLVRQFIKRGELGIVGDLGTWSDDVFGVTYRLVNPEVSGKKYICLVDGRNDKKARRYFTLWHELAHIIAQQSAHEEVFHRDGEASSDPVESLMDAIAAELGFYAPFFTPHVLSVFEQEQSLSFKGVEAVRANACPDASIQATMLACLRNWPKPVAYFEATLGLKPKERQMLEARQSELFETPPPVEKLRITKATGNQFASDMRVRFVPNWRVPAESLIFSCFDIGNVLEGNCDSQGIESLDMWDDKYKLPAIDAFVDTRFVGGRVCVLVNPIE